MMPLFIENKKDISKHVKDILQNRRNFIRDLIEKRKQQKNMLKDHQHHVKVKTSFCVSCFPSHCCSLNAEIRNRSTSPLLFSTKHQQQHKNYLNDDGLRYKFLPSHQLHTFRPLRNFSDREVQKQFPPPFEPPPEKQLPPLKPPFRIELIKSSLILK